MTLRAEIKNFIDAESNCSRRMVIAEFPAHSEATIYRNISHLIKEGEIFNLQNGTLSLTRPGSQKPEWPMHPVLRNKEHSATQLPLLSEFIVDPVRFRRIIDPIVEEYNQELVMLLVNIQVILAAYKGVNLSEHYPDIQPADKESLANQIRSLKQALSSYDLPIS